MGSVVSSVFGGGDSGPSAGELISQRQAQQVGRIGPGGRAVFESGPFGRVIRTTLSPEAQRLSQILGPQVLGAAEQLGDPRALAQEFVSQRLDVLRPEIERQEAQLRERLVQSGNPLAVSGEESPGAAAALERFARQRALQEQQLASQAVTQARGQQLGELAQLQALAPQFQAPQVGTQGVDVASAQAQAEAARQRQQQAVSSGLGSLAGLGSAFLLACWVAEELYGDTVKTWVLRDWVLRHDNIFTRAYRKHGITWARWCKQSKIVRAVCRFIWDRIYVRAKQNG